MDQQPKLLDQVRAVARARHLSYKTENVYHNFIKRFILFHKKHHPREMGPEEISALLTHLAVNENVSASTQNQALLSLLFLYRDVLKINLPRIEGVVRAKRPERIPVVFTPREAKAVLASLTGVRFLVASLLYGAGLRLTEALRLRVKDLDFESSQITVRDGKGAKDRTTLFPTSLHEPLRHHLEGVKFIHSEDLRRGFGEVWLPYALSKKYPKAGKEWKWQYVFPSARISPTREDGQPRRHHTAESNLKGGLRCEKQRFTNTEIATRFDTASPRTCWKIITIFGPCRSCSAIRTFGRRRLTRTSSGTSRS